MNAALQLTRDGLISALTPRRFTEVLAKFSEPRAGDLFEWCRDTDTFAHIAWSLSFHNVRYEPSMLLSDLKAVIERFEEREIRKGEQRSRYFDINRLCTFRQMLRTIEQYRKSL